MANDIDFRFASVSLFVWPVTCQGYLAPVLQRCHLVFLSMSDDVVLVPLKRFDLAKKRLRRSGAVDSTSIARDLAIAVIAACRPRRIVVVGESPQLGEFASELGVEYFDSGADDLNGAVQLAYRRLAWSDQRVFVVHGDLRDPQGLGLFEPDEGVTIVTDHHGTGTTVLVVPGGLDFLFCYGPDSARRHQREAIRLGVRLRIINDSPWAWDVDEVDDL